YLNPAVSVAKLEKYNMQLWLMSLQMVLSGEGALDAIKMLLDKEDPRNIRACVHIHNSVPSELKGPILNKWIAFEMVEALKAKWEKPSYQQQKSIEDDLTSMRLTKWDAESVEKHIKSVTQKLHALEVAGVQMT